MRVTWQRRNREGLVWWEEVGLDLHQMHWNQGCWNQVRMAYRWKEEWVKCLARRSSTGKMWEVGMKVGLDGWMLRVERGH